jgi:phosphoadenosine phosphosulfate reductase
MIENVDQAERRSYKPLEALEIALERHHPNIGQACSFQVEAIVILDMMLSIRKDARVFAIDTGRLPPETYEVAEEIRRRYGNVIRWYFPDKNSVEQLVNEKGLFSFRESIENRKECCHIRKVEPLGRALKGMTAWITGLRREQSITRSNLQQFEIDHSQGGIEKINPLIEWTTQEVWNYVMEHKLPYNRLSDQGYAQIGCEPCTSPIRPHEDHRAGRWRWESPEHKECGLHIAGSGI